jgi:multiple sugar transport system substrate-binding protein
MTIATSANGPLGLNRAPVSSTGQPTRGFAASLLIGGGLLVGCPNPNENPPGSAPAGKIVLNILGEDAANIRALEALQGEYEAKHPGVDLVFHPNTFEDAFTKANSDFAKGTAKYDIVLQYNFSLSSFARNNYVVRLGERPDAPAFETDIFPNVWKELGYYYKDWRDPSAGIEAIAYPFAANSMLLVYNRALFEDKEQQRAYADKHGRPLAVPTTWNEYRDVAEFFTQPAAGLHGVVMQGSAGSWLYYEWSNYLFSFGGRVMDKDLGWESTPATKVVLDSPEAVAAARYFKGLKAYNAGTFTATDGVSQVEIMKKGRVAMAIMWSDYATMLTDGVKSPAESAFGFAPIPGDKSLIAGGSFYVNKASPHQDEALEYIQHVMQPTTQVALLTRGLCSPSRSAYAAPEAGSVAFAKALEQSLTRGVYMLEAGPDADLVSNTLTKHMQRLWNDELAPEEAIRAADEEIRTQRAEVFKHLE